MEKNKSNGIKGTMDSIKAGAIKKTGAYWAVILLLTIALIATACEKHEEQDVSGDQSGLSEGGAPEVEISQSGAPQAEISESETGQGAVPGSGKPGMDMGPTGFFMYNAGEPFPDAIESQMTAAIYVKDGVYLANKSIPTALSGGKVESNSASGVMITSQSDNFSGILVNGGKTEYTLSDSTIDIYGNGTGGMMGGNYGVGAGAVAGNGILVLRNVKIATNGTGSCAATCSAGGTLKVYNSSLVSKSGGSAGRGSRTTNVTTNGKSYYYNSTIIAESWGALSTDSAEPNIYLEANNCDIQTIQSGYGAYSDNNCEVVINNSRFNTAGPAGVISGTGKLYLNNINATTGSNCVMNHAPGRSYDFIGTLEINGGKITSKDAVILVKSANIDITIDGAELVSESSVLIQSVINDDTNTATVSGPVTGIRAILKNMNLQGDINHKDTTRSMSVAFINTTLNGSIKDASISLDASSSWTATADSEVTLDNSIEVAKINAPNGVIIDAVAGEGCTLKGAYKLLSGGTLNVRAN